MISSAQEWEHTAITIAILVILDLGVCTIGIKNSGIKGARESLPYVCVRVCGMHVFVCQD